MDHTRTWTFNTRLPPQDCLKVFVEALEGSTKLGLMKASWTFSEQQLADSVRIVATYEGRAGVAAAATSSMWMSTTNKIWIFKS